MKRILLYMIALGFLASCQKDEKVFNKSVDERIKDTLTKYQNMLVDAPNGWFGTVFPAGGGGYSFYFSFDKDGRVKMVSDFDSTTSVDLKESSYRLKALQQPVLMFDTYNYIHLLSDPDAEVNNGEYGGGLYSDFEFAISDSSNADTIKLKGRLHGSKAFLRRATAAEKTAFLDKQFYKSRNELKKLGNILYYFKRLTTNNGNLDIIVNIDGKTAIISWKDSNGNVHRVTTGFYFTLNGIGFEIPITINGQTFSEISNISWSTSAGTLNGTVFGAAASIAGTSTPVAPDLQAPKDFVQLSIDEDYFLYSEEGFHINGVDNALRVDTLTSTVGPSIALIYWANFGADYDRFSPLFVNTATNQLTFSYGYGHTRNITADGRIIFTYTYNLGGTPPSSGAAFQSNALFRGAQGFYFVRTGTYTWDMVSASDSRIWISWTYPA